LWLSGKNTGETARLWIILMPFLMWIAGPLFESPAPRALEIQGPAAEPSRMLEATWLGHSGWAAALALQLATTTALAMRVVGFHYP
jgi:hypothetical protein